jgi:hypothetical protein
MALPEQIRKQTEAVQELYKQLNVDNNTGTDTPPADGTDTSKDLASTLSPADENPETITATLPPADEQKTGDTNVPEDTVVQKYKTLQGMYNAEVPRLHQQNKEMQQRIQQMEQLLASVSQQQTTTNTPQPEPTIEKLVSEREVEEYGESIDVMRKVSREELIPIAQKLGQLENILKQMQVNVIPQVQAVAQKQHVSAEQSFWADLGRIVPNWQEVNNNEAFQSWLLEADPLTGITRQTYLDDAQRSLDAARVSNFFRTWLEVTGQANVAQPTGRAANTELEKQVAPGRSRSAGSPTSANKGKVYTPQDITNFFNDVRSGKYKGREQERDRIERDIFAAQREDRIQVNA